MRTVCLRIDLLSLVTVIRQLHRVIEKAVPPADVINVNKSGMMPGDRFKRSYPVEFPVSNIRLRKHHLDGPESTCECFSQPNFAVRASPDRANKIVIRNIRYA